MVGLRRGFDNIAVHCWILEAQPGGVPRLRFPFISPIATVLSWFLTPMLTTTILSDFVRHARPMLASNGVFSTRI